MITSSQRGRYDWPWRGGPSFITPDGSQVVLHSAALDHSALDHSALDHSGLNHSALDTSRPWSANFVALVRGARRSFTVAEAGAFDWHSTYTTVPDRLLRQPYRGAELVVGIRDDPARGEAPDYRAAWRGQWFELHTRSSGAPEGITAVFDAFRLTDTPLGMLAQPRSAGQAVLEPVRVAKEVPGIGYLTIQRPGTGPVVIPQYRGHPTRHGELWRQPLGPGAHGRSRPDALILATPTAITRLVPGPADTADPREVLTFLGELNVIWEPA